MSFVRRIPEGGFYPGRWYGAAWDEWDKFNRVTVVCLPIPLNVIARFGYGLWCRLRSGWPARHWGASYICKDCRKRTLKDDWSRMSL